MGVFIRFYIYTVISSNGELIRIETPIFSEGLKISIKHKKVVPLLRVLHKKLNTIERQSMYGLNKTLLWAIVFFSKSIYLDLHQREIWPGSSTENSATFNSDFF